MKKCALFMALLVCVQALMAEDPPGGQTASGELILQVSSLPEVKLGFTEHFRFPFLQGESPLTEGNNIDLAVTAEISPVSLNGIAEAVWTPVAFFQMAAGGRIGSGWNIELFGSKSYGIGLTQPGLADKLEHDGSAFDGLLWKVQAGGVLQFDLAALFPGDWHHVVARSYHEVNYRGYTRAKAGESWYYENDDGENCNGFNYYANLLVGYQMPVFISMAALLAEADLYLYDLPDRSRWGDEKIRWTFSGIAAFTFTDQFGLALIAQFRTRRNYVEPDWEDRYYRSRNIDSSRPLRLEFYRIAAALTYKL
jgi:hypothetical protein